jgi:hypothetical protein
MKAVTPAPSRRRDRRPALAWLRLRLRLRLGPAALAGALLLASAALPAAPAPWFKWRSKLDGATVCAQTPLGPGWERAGGPYRDSRCEKPSHAK